MKIEEGKEYDVERRGWPTFRIVAKELDDEFVLGQITKGVARFKGMPDRGPGNGIWLSTKNTSIKLTPVE